jgi:hypothetical protein
MMMLMWKAAWHALNTDDAANNSGPTVGPTPHLDALMLHQAPIDKNQPAMTHHDSAAAPSPQNFR